MEASQKFRYLSRMFYQPCDRIVGVGRHPPGLTLNDLGAGESIALLTASPFVGFPSKNGIAGRLSSAQISKRIIG